MSLTTLDRLRELRSGLVPDDTLGTQRATDCLTAASLWLSRQAPIGEVTEFDIWTQADGRVLPVPLKPIISVDGLTVDGLAWTVLDAGDSDAGQWAVIDASRFFIASRFGRFPAGVGNIRLEYTGGFDTTPDKDTGLLTGVPDDVQQAVAMLAGILIEETNRLGITAKSLGPENVNMIARNVKDYGFLQAVVNHWSRIY